MREIEVKAKIKNKDNLIKKLNDLGCVLSEPKHQHDRVYFPNGVTFEGNNLKNHNVLRIRTESSSDNQTHTFTFKKATGDYLNKIEKESKIVGAQEMHEIILALGYYLFIEIKKSRTTSRFNDYEICIDEVDELGTFVEIEKIVDEEVEGDEIIQELNEFLIKLGINPSDNVTKGYDILLGSQKYLNQ